jgi:hypothetical protein
MMDSNAVPQAGGLGEVRSNSFPTVGKLFDKMNAFLFSQENAIS